MKYLFLLFFTLQLSPVVTAAPIYKWVDEDGQVHYGSKPQDESAKEIKIKNKLIDSGSSSGSLNAEQRADKLKRFVDSIDKENQSKADEKRKKQEKRELKVTRCNASRDQLRRYENSGALYDLDEKGNRILLNKKQYEQAMRQARARVQKWCN